jgi:hypothetical protein
MFKLPLGNFAAKKHSCLTFTLFKVFLNTLANFSVILFGHLTTKYLGGKLKVNKTGIFLK